ncbi:50S ribosomal protein L28, partial [Candidatus Poribacteria bacterium]|nr:50S ribosomal protein L28 [Candidatus Poribacteria bacterium]
QRVRVKTETGTRRIRVCTSCIRSGKVIKVISRMPQVPS